MRTAGSRRADGAVAVAALAIAAIACPTAHAWTPIAPGSPRWATTVPYSMNTSGSSDLGRDTSEAEVQRAMTEWTRVSCAGLSVSYGGRTSSLPSNGDGQSMIGWLESGWPFDSNAIGVTSPAWDGAGRIVEADMWLNGQSFDWTTGSGFGASVNAYSIVLHEGGHFYGLGHSADDTSAMYFAYRGGVLALNADDEAGICTLYPGSSAPATDCTTTGCPSGEVCIDGACRAARTGDGTICAPCSSGTECGGGANFCLRYPDGVGYCGRACTSSADCDGDRCMSVSGYLQCVRLDGAGEPSCTAPAAGCATSGCPSGEACVDGACRASGSGCETIGCAAGQECVSGACHPVGSGCETTGCASAERCVSGTCEPVESCETAGCPPLMECIGGACVPDDTPAGLGESCATNEECATRMCATDATMVGAYCTRTCDRTTPCPTGFACESVGALSVCARRADAATSCTSAECRTLRGSACAIARIGDDAHTTIAPLAALCAAIVVVSRRRTRRRVWGGKSERDRVILRSPSRDGGCNDESTSLVLGSRSRRRRNDVVDGERFSPGA